MTERESTDDADTGADSKKGPSTDPWPEIERETDGTATGDEPTVTDQTSDDDETGTARQDDERTGEGGGQSHGCDPDSPVPCRFQ